MEGIEVHRKESSRMMRRSPHTSHVSLFQRVWGSVEADAERRWSALTRQLDVELVSLLQEASDVWLSDMESRYQVSATVVRLGVNTPDHSRIFRRLRRSVSHQLTPHVVCLRSCGTMRGLMQTLVRRLVGEAGLHTLGLSAPLQASYHAVERWFSKQATPPRALVVMLEDCESLSPRLLQDFVAVTSVHAARLPLLLVLGVASHLGVVQGLLGGVASSRLRLSVVTAPAPSMCRRRVLEPLLLPTRDCPFSVGAKTRAFLLDTFSRLDFSLHSFLQRLRLCLMQHLLGLPVAVIDALWIALITGDKTRFKDAGLTSVLAHMKEQQRCRAAAHFLGKLIGVSSVDLRTAAAASGGLAKAEAWTRAVALWLKSPTQTLVADIEAACNDKAKTGELDEQVDALRKELGEMAAALKNEETTQSPASSTRRQPAASLAGNMSLKQLQAGLKAMHAAGTESQSPADLLQQRLRRCLLEKAAALIPDVRSTPGWESIMFDDVDTVRNLLNPTQRADLQMALAKPSVYLQPDLAAQAAAAACSSQHEAARLDARLPDLSILYKLHLECPTFINLYDWLQAFNAVIGEREEQEGVPTRSVQARFVLGVSELHFLGLVKATARKTDHVVRLTWGSC